mgnify:CR=1 FL=1|tara:strand:+ start:135 stop:881 length:747 start_codon:yes stop_codon:yes gene_type:complete
MKTSRLFLFCIIYCSLSCGCKNNSERIIILSKASKNYVNWLDDGNTIILDAYTINNNDSILKLADGIVLTGGEDINPLEYNDSSNLPLCGPIDFYRDTLERNLFDFALKNKIPLVGICRGMQMINVALDGTLYGDLPTDIGTTVIHRHNGEVMHEIYISSNSIYYNNLIFPSNIDTFSVNSWHHQGLKNVSPYLNIIANSYDGLPEAVAVDTSVHPFMIAVQFHPERLGTNNSIHKQMRASFFNAIAR